MRTHLSMSGGGAEGKGAREPDTSFISVPGDDLSRSYLESECRWKYCSIPDSKLHFSPNTMQFLRYQLNALQFKLSSNCPERASGSSC